MRRYYGRFTAISDPAPTIARCLASINGEQILLGRSRYSSQHGVHQLSRRVSSDASLITTHSSSSTTTTGTTKIITPDERAGSTILNAPRPLFPWRHEVDPLPSVAFSPFRRRDGTRTFLDLAVENIITNIVAFGGLQIPWYKVLGNTWRNDLANSAAFAFSQSVTAVLNSAYRVPWNDDTDHDDLLVNFDSQNESNDKKYNTNNTDCPDVEDMLDELLVQKYQAAHEYGRDQIRVKLQMRPVTAQLNFLFGAPHLTRAEVRQDPSLQQKIPGLFLEAAEVSGGRNFVKFVTSWSEEMMMEQMNRRNEPIVSTTILAQVQVCCDEVFSVRDVATGALLQGDGDDAFRPVFHLVHLEMIVDYNMETGELHKGNWIITDWDDLLDGNIWFM